MCFRTLAENNTPTHTKPYSLCTLQIMWKPKKIQRHALLLLSNIDSVCLQVDIITIFLLVFAVKVAQRKTAPAENKPALKLHE